MENKYHRNIVGWEEILKNLPKSYKKWFAEEKKFFRKYIKKDSNVLEIGCGNGRSLIDILKITKNITGIDNDKLAVEHTKNNLKNILQSKIILADGKNLPFEDESFDFVTCIGTFANLGKDKYAILSEMKRVLKYHGDIIISVYSEKAFPERIKIYRKNKFNIKEVKKDGTVIFKGKKDIISEQFSKEDLADIFNKAKLKINVIKDAGIGYICMLSKQ